MTTEIEYILTAEDSDVLTTEDGIELLAFYVIENLDYGLGIDWDGDGNYDDFQEANRVVRWSCERGREKIFKPSGDGFNPYQIGRLNITLDNHDGRYDPWNADGPLYGNIMPGRDIQFKVSVYDADDNTDEHTTYFIFTGTVVDIQVNGRNSTVNLIAEDGWRFLADWSYFREPFTTGNYGVGNELLDIFYWTLTFNESAVAYSWLSTRKYPWSYDIQYIAGITDIPRHWWWDGTAKGAVEMITFGSLGRSYVRSDNLFGFRDFKTTTDASVATLDEDILLDKPYLAAPWENMRSEVVLRGSNNYIYGFTGLTIASLLEPLLVEAGETINASLRYKYEGINDIYCTRITDITFAAYTTPSTSGTVMTEYIQHEINPGLKDIKLTATNTSSTDAYITTFDIEGEPLEVIPTTWRYEADNPYRTSSFTLSSPWLSVTSIGSTDGYVQETETTANDKARIDLVGESLLSYLSSVQPFPVVQMRGRYHEQFELELEDKVTLTMPTMGIDDDFRINKISHRSVKSLQDILTTIWLYPPITPAST